MTPEMAMTLLLGIFSSLGGLLTGFAAIVVAFREGKGA